MRRSSMVAALLACILLAGCGGGDSEPSVTSGPAVTTASTLAASATTAPNGADPTVPTGFPVEIMTGGTVQSSYPTEVTVVYPESSYDSLVAFYDEWTNDRPVVANDMFPSGREWQIQEEPLVEIQVTLDDQGAKLFARVVP